MKVDNSLSKFKNTVAWFAVVLLTCVTFLVNYRYDFSLPLKLILWITWFLLAVLFAYFTTQGKDLLVFAKDAKVELQKVVWPTRNEAVQITVIVIIMVCLTGMLLWGVDTFMMWVIGKVTHLS